MSETVIGNRLWYIENCLNDPIINIAGPFVSTVLLILAVPYISNRAFWVSQYYKQWRINKKKEFEKKTLLTEEQSVKILLDMEKQKVDYATSFTTYNEEKKSAKALSDQLFDDLNKLYENEKSNLLTGYNAEKTKLAAEIKKGTDEIKELKKTVDGLTNSLIEGNTKQQGLIIHRAEYGDSNDFKDVKDLLQKRVKDDRLQFLITDSYLGTPHLASDKKLSIIYALDGKFFHTIRNENDEISIPDFRRQRYSLA